MTLSDSSVRQHRATMLRSFLRSRNGNITYGALMQIFGVNRFELKRILGVVMEIDLVLGVRDIHELACSKVVNAKTWAPGPGYNPKLAIELFDLKPAH